MIEKKDKSMAKFSLTVNGGTVIERCFPIDQYSPDVRYSIDIRDGVDEIIKFLEHLLKMQDVNAIYDRYELKPKEKWVGKTGKVYKKKDEKEA